MSATDLEYIGDASAQLVRAVRGFLGFANELADRHPRRFLAVSAAVFAAFAALAAVVAGREQAKAIRAVPSAHGSLAELADPEPPPTPLARQATKKVASTSFSARLRAILKVCYPSMFCKEMGNTVSLCAMLVGRTMLSIFLATTQGRAAQALVEGDRPAFIRSMQWFALTGVPASLCNSGIKYCTSVLSLRFQRRLTDRLNRQYITGVNFYKATELPEFRIDNVDQRVTTDVEEFCDQGTEMFCNIFKPTLDVVLHTTYLVRDVGIYGPVVLAAYFALAVAAKLLCTPNFKRMVKRRSELVGNYRTAHSRLIAHAEEIAFYEGAGRERSIIRQRFDAVYWHMRTMATKAAAVGVLDTWIDKYGASITGYFILALPVLVFPSSSSVAQNTNDFFKRRQVMSEIGRGLGALLLVGTQLKMLSGTTARVSEVFESIKRLNESGTKRFEIKHETKPPNPDGETAAVRRSPSRIFDDEMKFLREWKTRMQTLRDEDRRRPALSDSPRPLVFGGGSVVEGPVVEFADVQLVSPDGRHLISDPLNFKVPKGKNIMLTGPNGCGKSSLFRVLGELWPPYSGVITKPPKSEIMFVPQKPYLVMGTLRDQIIYPDSHDEMLAKGVTDEDLVSLLALVDPAGIIVERWDFDQEMNWALTLSGGQKQRVAMARLFYHQPLYAILDECTSAVSDDVTDKIYETCGSLGITLFTIAHQKTVIKHHKLILRFDGRGGWELENVEVLASQRTAPATMETTAVPAPEPAAGP